MSKPTIPSSLRAILFSFCGCFSVPAFCHFEAFVTGWILCVRSHTISRIIQAAGSLVSCHFTSAYRFLSKSPWVVDSLSKRLFHLCLKRLPEADDIDLLGDDTLCHRSGPHVFGAAMHYDASKSTYGRGTDHERVKTFSFGHDWVVLAIWVPVPWCSAGIAIPIAFRLYRSPKRCPEDEYRKRTELMAELVQLVASWLPEGRQAHLIVDSEYSCKTVFRALPSNVSLQGSMPMKAALYELPPKSRGKRRRGRPRLRGKRLPSPLQMAESNSRWQELKVFIYGRKVTLRVKSVDCLWYSVAGPKLVRVVMTRDPNGQLADRVYFSTDTELSVEQIIVKRSRRWQIEVTFRDAKQYLGIEDPQNGWWRDPEKPADRKKKQPGPQPKANRGRRAVEHTTPLGFIVYALTVLWYLDYGNAERDVRNAKANVEWYAYKTCPSFGDMLAALRREIWLERFRAIPGVKIGRKRLEKAMPLWLLTG